MNTAEPVRETTISGAAIGPTGPTEPAQRATALRLARLHLRLGSLGLARAELEALAGSGELDEAALLDLAEVRWRTGDLPGAGEAATAAIATGDDSALALVIAAEAAASSSRPAEARRLAGQALERADASLDGIFAGMPRSAIWPHDTPTAERATTDATDRSAAPDAPSPGAAGSAAAVAAGTGHGTRVRPTVAPFGHTVEPTPLDAPIAVPADEAVAAGRALLAAGDRTRAAAAFGLALRAAPAAASDVIEALGGGDAEEDPALDLVRADALRLIGRVDEALALYRRSFERLARAADRRPGGPPET